MSFWGLETEENEEYDKVLLMLEKELEELNDESDDLESDDEMSLYKIINFEPTKLRVSTITAICDINTKYINLETITKYICSSCGLLVENIINYHKCIKTKKKKNFYNQRTMLIQINNKKKINLKIFLNGTVHLTGLKTQEEGIEAVNILIKKIKKIDKNITKNKIKKLINQCESKNTKSIVAQKLINMYNNLTESWQLEEITEQHVEDFFKDNYDNSDYKILTDIFEYIKKEEIDLNIINSIHHFKKSMIVRKNDLEKLTLKNFKICLINSDFSVGFKIKREILFELLVNKYNMYATYEPDIYPGVNSKFYWNKRNKGKKHFGVCSCNVKCDGKGNGDGHGNCKKVTIAIFQSGKIIITGARNLEQVNDSYSFINKVLDKHYDQLKRKDFSLKKTDDLLESNKHIYKSLVKNFVEYKNLSSLSQKELTDLSK